MGNSKLGPPLGVQILLLQHRQDVKTVISEQVSVLTEHVKWTKLQHHRNPYPSSQDARQIRKYPHQSQVLQILDSSSWVQLQHHETGLDVKGRHALGDAMLRLTGIVELRYHHSHDVRFEMDSRPPMPFADVLADQQWRLEARYRFPTRERMWMAEAVPVETTLVLVVSAAWTASPCALYCSVQLAEEPVRLLQILGCGGHHLNISSRIVFAIHLLELMNQLTNKIGNERSKQSCRETTNNTLHNVRMSFYAVQETPGR
jgi:hypothetical protein